MHGARAGAPQGAKNGMYRTGKYTREARAISKYFTELAKGGEVLLATTLDRVGLGRKVPAALRRRSHIRRARVAAKAEAKETVK
jgi:hypothetical protein